MKFNKEQLAAKKEFIQRGSTIICDMGGPVQLARSHDDNLAAIRQRLDALRKKIEAVATTARH